MELYVYEDSTIRLLILTLIIFLFFSCIAVIEYSILNDNLQETINEFNNTILKQEQEIKELKIIIEQ